MNYIGWLGSFLLSICGAFECFRSFQTKRCEIGWGMLLSWGLGEVFLLIYVAKTLDMPLITNYSCNLLMVSVMIYYKVNQIWRKK